MTKEHRQSDTQNGDAADRKPTMLGYTITPVGEGKKSIWSKVAAAWAHKDGEGYEVRMDALPVDGRLVLRRAKEDVDGIEPGQR